MQVRTDVMFVDLLAVCSSIMQWSLLTEINVMENTTLLSAVLLGSSREKIFLVNTMKFRELGKVMRYSSQSSVLSLQYSITERIMT